MKDDNVPNSRPSPLCERLCEGHYPSHVKELKETAYPLHVLELGLAGGRSFWPAVAHANIPELPSGVVARQPQETEGIPQLLTVRVLGAPGGFMSASQMRAVAGLAERFGQGALHWSTGGTTEIDVEPSLVLEAVRELNEFGLDVGSTGDGVRNITACPGTLRCDAALINAVAVADAIGRAVIDDQQYPGLPAKVKTAVAGCPRDCARAQVQKDHAFIGVYRGIPQVDQEKVGQWEARERSAGRPAGRHVSTLKDLILRCPGKAISEVGGSVMIDPEECVHCMFCISTCPAFTPGPQRGVAWVAGGKYGSRGRNGPMAGFVLAAFVPATPGYAEIVDLYQRFLDLFLEHGRRRERIGDMLMRLGPQHVQELMGLEIDPVVPGRMVHGQ